MLFGDGDGFVRCSCGHLHWGVNGAAGLLLFDPERGVLLQRRAWWVHHGRTWGLPGGALRRAETAKDGAIREAREEAAVPRDAVHLTAASVVDHGPWRYTTVLGSVHTRFEAKRQSRESAGVRWVPPDKVASYQLHRDFAEAWPQLRARLDRRVVLVVDGANVVGTRPDGWWRDRAAAAGRLRDRLAGLSRQGIPGSNTAMPAGDDWSWWPRMVLVVEGQARDIQPVDGVEVVAAPADGDATVVAVAREAREGDHVVAVTADRELGTRVEAEGATRMGPTALLDLLDVVGS